MVDKEGLLQHFHDNPFLQINHMELVDAGEDWAQMELKVYEGSLNPLGLVHGGALFTLADSAGGAAAHTDGRDYVTLSSSFTFLHSALPGDTVRAKGTVRRRGQTTCYVNVDVTNQKEELLASGNYTFFHIPEMDGRFN